MAAVRGKNFNGDELKQLCLSYLEISQDACVGTGQRKESFWERVAENYNTHKASGWEKRTSKSLETKWGDVRKDTTRFVGCVEAVEKRNESGISTDDKLERALQLFQERHAKKKEFAFLGCYHILKKEPRWSMPPDTLKKKRQGSNDLRRMKDLQKGNDGLSEDITTTIVGAEGDSAIESPQSDSCSKMELSMRPMGSKQAKERAKKQKLYEDTSRIAAAAQKKMADASVERLKLAENQSLLMLLTMPGFENDPYTVELIKEIREKEIMRLKLRVDAASPPLTDVLLTESALDKDSPPARRQDLSLPRMTQSDFDSEEPMVGFRGSPSVTMSPSCSRFKEAIDLSADELSPITACRSALPSEFES